MSSRMIRSEGREAAAREGRGPRRSARSAAAGQPSRIAGPRLALLAAVCTLVALGLVMVFSASAVTRIADGSSAQAELVDQFVFIVLGIGVSVLVARVFDYRLLVGVSFWLVAASILVLLYTKVAGSTANGATRWISIFGMTIQPAEFVKICLILFATSLFCRIPREERTIANGEFLLALGVGGATLVLILLQPDKGTVFVVFMALWVMAMADGYNRWRLLLAAGGLIVAYLLFAMSEDYSRRRVMALLDPFADETDTGYQLAHGFYAFASGGIFGRGLGMGLQKYAYLPEAHNDFILPIIGEELGLLGVLFVFACFAVIAWAGWRIAEEADDELGRLLAVGCVALLVGQAILNFAGVLGIVPMTGKAVPFVSAGGSSMLASFAILGLLVNISLRSTATQSVFERRRSRFRLADGPAGEGALGRAGALGAERGLRLVPGGTPRVPTPAKAPVARQGLRAVEGGATRENRVSGARSAPPGAGAAGRRRPEQRRGATSPGPHRDGTRPPGGSRRAAGGR